MSDTVAMKKINFSLLLLFTSYCTFGKIVVLDGLMYNHVGASGQIIRNKIRVRNEGTKETRIIIYKQDYLPSCDGELYQDSSSSIHSLSKWLTTTIDEKSLLPNEEVEIGYTISIPKDVKPEQAYWATLMIEESTPIVEENRGGLKISSKVRYAIGLIADIGDTVSPRLSFENISYKKIDSATTTLQIKIKNGGKFISRTKNTIEVYNQSGTKLKTIETTYRRIYPNSCNSFEANLGQLSKGDYYAVIVADNGKELFGTNVNIKVE